MNIKKLCNEYYEQGFIHIKESLAEDYINELRLHCASVVGNNSCDNIEAYHRTENKIVNCYFPRSHTPEVLKETIDDIVENTVISRLLNTICEGNFTIDTDFTLLSWLPENFQKGFTGYHQDGPSDNSLEGLPHVWIPITESREFNLGVIPKTHNLGNLEHTMFGQFIKVKQDEVTHLEEKGIKIKVDVGDILIFSTRILHCLLLNYTDQICWSLEFICNKEAENEK